MVSLCRLIALASNAVLKNSTFDPLSDTDALVSSLGLLGSAYTELWVNGVECSEGLNKDRCCEKTD